MFVRLALRNLFRHTGRTIATGLVIFFSVAAMMLAYGFVAGFGDQMIIQSIRTEYAEIQVYASQREDNINEPDMDDLIFNAAQVVIDAEAVSGVEAATPLLRFAAMLNDGVNDLPIVVSGFDPDTIGRVLKWPEAAKHGEPLGQREGVWIGRRVAKMMDREIGDSITIELRTAFDMIEAVDVEIVGLLDSGYPRLDDYQALMPLSMARGLADVEHEATEILVRTRQEIAEELAGPLGTALNKAGHDVRVETWQNAAKALIDGTMADRVSSVLILGLIMLMGFIGLINTLLIASFERRREIGTMMALGWRVTRVRILFIVEGMITAIGFGLPGILLGSGVTYWMSRVGIDYGLSEEAAAEVGMPISGKIYPLFLPEVAVVLFLVTFFLAVLASWYPAYLAGKSDPVKALNA